VLILRYDARCRKTDSTRLLAGRERRRHPWGRRCACSPWPPPNRCGWSGSRFNL